MNRLIRYLWMEDRFARWVVALTLVAIFALFASVARAQARTVVSFGDSALLITKTSCTTACDSARVSWLYNGQRYSHTVTPKKADTVRVKRGEDSLQATPFFLSYRPTIGKLLTVPPLSSVVALEFHNMRGERLRTSVGFTVGDSMYVVSVRRYSDGSERPFPVTGAQFDSTVLAVVRKSARGDTVWLVAK